jgi:manganese efflux pump family protein
VADSVHIGEIITVCLMAIALGMDSFSVSLGIGMSRAGEKQIWLISAVNGVFHMIMPFLGILTGRYLTDVVGQLAVYIGGSILVFFGVHMLFSSFMRCESVSWVSTTGWGIVLFSIGVSLDSFSVGLSLGLFFVNMWLSILLFGLAAALLTALGLVIGRKTGRWVGGYSEACGGIILIAFGIKFLL